MTAPHPDQYVPPTCKCGRPAAPELHRCPYQADVNGDPAPYCDCCERCEDLCCDEI